MLHLFIAPYTKVEESFNIQAAYDILKHGIPLTNTSRQLALNYDHVTFSGAVPRTFIGALTLAELSRPFTPLVYEGVQEQMLVRAILGLINASSLLAFHSAVRQAFGITAGYWWIFLTISQFHVPYYASRTLPNTFAFALTTLALRSFILSNFGPASRRQQRHRLTIYLLTLAGVIFRSELILLLFPVTLDLLFRQRASLHRTIIPTGLLAFLIALIGTISIDSFFWQRFPLWPELHGLLFNVRDGQSALWGVEPWHWYFTSALPRLLLNPAITICLIPTALLHRSTQSFALSLLAPLVAYIALYSCLPHKESRFILYVVPGLTAVAAAGAASTWSRARTSVLMRLLSALLVLSVLATAAASGLLLLISALNYPGAFALARLHALAPRAGHVHLSNLACQTGVTRFLQQAEWRYDKSEPDASMGPLWYDRFEYVLAEVGPAGEALQALGNWEVLETVGGYAGVGISRSATGDDGLGVRFGKQAGTAVDLALYLLQRVGEVARRYATGGRWVSVRMEPRIWVLRNRGIAVDW